MSTQAPLDYGLPEMDGPVLRPGPNDAVGIVGALADVMGDLPSIGKVDTSPEGYAYRGIEAITKHLQQLLAKHRVVPVPHATIVKVVPSPAMKDGWQDVVMRVRWSLFHADGSSLTAATYGVGRDRSDKGANKAQTQAYKYLLLHVLCIADGKDDSDGQTYEDDRRPDTEAATADQVAAFYEVLGRLGDNQKAALRAWFSKERVPKVEKATSEQASKAIVKAREFLSSVPAPAEESPGEGVEAPGQGQLVGAS